jgi:glycine/D-amino acid oxidase-like deaminating enzyme
MQTERPDILIVGGGVLGSALAWQLTRKQAGSILVIDPDLAGTYSSSERNAGGARATWWHPLNAQLAWRSLQFFESIAEEIQFFQRGYLFLYSASRWKIAQEKRELYRRLGIPVEYLSPEEARPRLKEFENWKGIAGATFSPKDGLLDPHLLRDWYRAGAKEAGVRFQDHCYLSGVARQGKRVTEAQVRIRQAPASESELETLLTENRLGPEWLETKLHPKILINCSGAWLKLSSAHYGKPLPIEPVRRQIALFSSQAEDLSGHGMTVDSSGLYFHPEGTHSGLVLAGYSNRDEKPGYSFRYDGEKFFDRKIWLRLYRRGGRNHFDAIHHVRGWAGLYAVGPDKSAILGRAKELENVYELGAATGRGVMQSYALSLALAELIVDERFSTIDAAALSPSRFEREELVREDLDI